MALPKKGKIGLGNAKNEFPTSTPTSLGNLKSETDDQTHPTAMSELRGLSFSKVITIVLNGGTTSVDIDVLAQNEGWDPNSGTPLELTIEVPNGTVVNGPAGSGGSGNGQNGSSAAGAVLKLFNFDISKLLNRTINLVVNGTIVGGGGGGGAGGSTDDFAGSNITSKAGGNGGNGGDVFDFRDLFSDSQPLTIKVSGDGQILRGGGGGGGGTGAIGGCCSTTTGHRGSNTTCDTFEAGGSGGGGGLGFGAGGKGDNIGLAGNDGGPGDESQGGFGALSDRFLQSDGLYDTEEKFTVAAGDGGDGGDAVASADSGTKPTLDGPCTTTGSVRGHGAHQESPGNPGANGAITTTLNSNVALDTSNFSGFIG